MIARTSKTPFPVVHTADSAIDREKSDLLAYLQDPAKNLDKVVALDGEVCTRYHIRALDSVEYDDVIADGIQGERGGPRRLRALACRAALACVENFEREGDSITVTAKNRDAILRGIPANVVQDLGEWVLAASTADAFDPITALITERREAQEALQALLSAIADLDAPQGGDVTALDEYEAARRLVDLPEGETVERSESLGK